MNKKIYVGMMAFGIAASFWACGSGDIIKADDECKTMKTTPENDPAFGIVPSHLTPEVCPPCFEGSPVSSSSSKQQPPPSSATVPGPSSSVGSQTQSSSSEFKINLSSSVPYSYTPRSSTTWHGPTSSSSSSGGVVIPPNGVGSCAPVPATIDMGGTTEWTFTHGSAVNATQLLKASFTWEFEGVEPATVTVTGATGTRQKATYKKASGKHGAKVTLTLGGSQYPVTCSPVQVNGAKITGCKCSTEAKSVDYTATPDVKWTVTGCTTGAGLTLSYEWDGAPGSETYVKTFTAANPGYVPKLKVMNNDNTVIEVASCPAVKITDGPEYQITTTQKAGAIDLPKGTSAVVVSVQNDGYVFCQIDRAKANSTTGTFRGTVNKVPLSGNDYKEIQVTAGGIPVGSTLEFDIDVPLTCGVR